MARPTTYNADMLSTAQDYVAHSTNYGDIVPSVAGLSIALGVARSTIYLWAKEHEEFSDTLEYLLSFQEKELIQNGLTSVFNPVITKLMMGNHGYSDKKEVTGKDGTPLFDAETKEKGNAAIAAILPEGDTE